MIAPQVGVIKLTSPFAATNSHNCCFNTITKLAASGAIIGVDNVASPELDGTKN